MLTDVWISLQWRHNERDGVSNHRRHTQLFVQAQIKENIKAPRRKRPVTRKMFPFDDVIMYHHASMSYSHHTCIQVLANRTEIWSNDLFFFIYFSLWAEPVYHFEKWKEKHLPRCKTRQLLTFNVRGPSYLGLTRSISWLLMPSLLTSPGHQQPWYWLCRIGMFLSYLRKNFNYLRRIDVEKWHKV